MKASMSLCHRCGNNPCAGLSGLCAECEPPQGPTLPQVQRRFRSRRQRLLMAADAWRDFRDHWPMRLLELLGQLGSGFICGLLLGLAAVLYALEQLA